MHLRDAGQNGQDEHQHTDNASGLFKDNDIFGRQHRLRRHSRSWKSKWISIVLCRGKPAQVDITVGYEASQQDDRVDDKSCAVGHRGEEGDQKEPVQQAMHPQQDQSRAS